MMKQMIAIAALTVGFTAGSMTAAEARDNRMTVVGDSITARYNDNPGDPDRGWWSRLGAKHGMRVTTSAISGTGFINKGSACSHNNYLQRISEVAKSRPDVLIVEGGRNDFHKCGKRLSKKQIKRGVDKYFDSLDRIVKRNKIKRVYVVTIWGTNFSKHRPRVTKIVKARAAESGYPFKAITLGNSMTVDKTHPNTRGNVKIYRQMNRFIKNR